MDFQITKDHKKKILKLITSGEFKNESEVIKDALDLHRACQEKIYNLRKEIDKGWDSPNSLRTIKDILKSKKKFK